MSSVCFVIRLHIAPELSAIRLFDIGKVKSIIDENATRKKLDAIAKKSLAPSLGLIKSMLETHKQDFRLGIIISGITLDLLEKYQPEILADLKEIIANNQQVEVLAHTYAHSLCFLYNREVFKQQLVLHADRISTHFNQKPSVFASTEGIYGNQLGYLIQQLGYKGLLAGNLASSNQSHRLFHPIHIPQLGLMLEDMNFSNAIQFNLSEGLRAETLAGWISNIQGPLYFSLDLLEVGYHQDAKSGIFEFLKHLPAAILNEGASKFFTPSEIMNNNSPEGPFNANYFISREGSIDPWRGNPLQQEALGKLYKHILDMPESSSQLMQLQCSDFFYSMRKESPDYLDAYSNFLNILVDLELKKSTH